MKNTIKGFIVGFVMASLIVGSVTATVNQYLLTPASYPVIADGVNLDSEDYPILNYNGTTYLSLRKTAEAVNAELAWNDELKQAELNTKTQETNTITESKTEVEKGDTMQKEVFGEFKENTNIYLEEVNGEQYISLGAFSTYIIREEDNYYIKLPNQNAVLVKVGTEPTEHSITNVYKRTLVKLSSFNLTAEVNGDTITVYYK
jgi:uncharacterized membrane-anchored protein